MSGAARLVRPSLVMLMALGLVLGAYGFDGAIHSAHHLLASEAFHPHAADDSADERGASDAEPEQACHVAAAASHAAATAVEALHVIAPTAADSGMLPLVTRQTPRLPWTDPDRDRAPPVSRLLPS